MTHGQRHGGVCILGLNFPPEPTGIAPYTGALAAGLSRAGYQVTAHVAHPHYPAWQTYGGYGNWHRFERCGGVLVHRYRHYVPQPPRGIRRLLSEISFGIRVLAARWGSPRIVIAVSPALFATALVALRVRVTPRRPRLIVWVQDIYSLGVTETGEGGPLVERFTRWVESATLRSADRVIVIHPRFAEFVVERLGVAPSRVEVVRNWTHLPPSPPIDPSAAKVKLGWPIGPTLAVHTGNIGAKQGLENIVDAAREADRRGSRVHFILVGDGGERRRLENYARGIDRLSFVDPLGDEDYRHALSAADVLLVNEKPGVAEMAVPSKLTAYFDVGRPVVAATDPGGIAASELMEAEAGVVVPGGDPCTLLDAVLELGRNPQLAAEYGRNGRRYREAVLSEQTANHRWQSLIRATVATST